MPTSNAPLPISHDRPPQPPPHGPHGGPPPSLPSRPREPRLRDSYSAQSPTLTSENVSPTSPISSITQPKRSSQPPPVPGSAPAIPPPTPQSRAPPPPPPIGAPPSRVATGDSRIPPPVPRDRAAQESDEEVTEYEGDYDTDIAPNASHKEALKSYSKSSSKASSAEHDYGEDDIRDTRLPPSSTSVSAPRAVPPLPPSQPPSQPPRVQRQSSDMPRIPPPIPPPKEQNVGGLTSNYDSHDSMPPSQSERRRMETISVGDYKPSAPENPDQLDTTSPVLTSSHYALGSSLNANGRQAPRQSLDVQRNSSSARRSTEAPRASSEQGYIAEDVDLGRNSLWWVQPNTPPPLLQNRREIIYEVEESSTTRRGGRQAITKTVYVLYIDYSQTIITAHFDPREPSEAALEQHHEPPPSRLRQDQLETAHTRFGSHIAEGANAKKETTVGDGTPNALILDLLLSLPNALGPVGVRSYGALVYTNLANASVQQFDEIRAGDIVTFRNAKFQGHRGAMHAKYSADVGKPDHVAVVLDWDGTKKKVHAYEQGRESRKVKVESFKLGDMRSGEVKVWRVMARQWVGWE
ncbi:MAG: hypothetical protein Q9190_001476 [Brigantiaea leucoxantha]